jgi:tetratricopeptide (TPR) repeat protein
LGKQLAAYSDSVKSAYATGRDAAARGDFIRAEERYTAALAFEPDAVMIHYELAAAYVSLGRPADALREFSWVVEREPEFARAWMGLGLSYLERDEFSTAESALREAVRLDPTLGPAHGGLSLALRRQGRTAEAEARLVDLARRFPDQQGVWLSLGDLLADLPGETLQRRSMEAYGRANAVQATAYGTRREGQVALRLGEMKKSEQLLRQSSKLDPRDPATQYLLARVLQKAGLPDAVAAVRRARETQAVARRAAEFRGLIAENPVDPAPYFGLARLEKARGDGLAAIRYFRAALRLDPENERARSELNLLEDQQMRTQAP